MRSRRSATSRRKSRRDGTMSVASPIPSVAPTATTETMMAIVLLSMRIPRCLVHHTSLPACGNTRYRLADSRSVVLAAIGCPSLGLRVLGVPPPDGAESACVTRGGSCARRAGSNGESACGDPTGAAALGTSRFEFVAPSPGVPVATAVEGRSYPLCTLPLSSTNCPGARTAVVRPSDRRMRSRPSDTRSVATCAPAGVELPAGVSMPSIHATRWVSPRTTIPLNVAVRTGDSRSVSDWGSRADGSGAGAGAATFPAPASSRNRSSSARCSGLEKRRPMRDCARESPAGGRSASAPAARQVTARSFGRLRVVSGASEAPEPARDMLRCVRRASGRVERTAAGPPNGIRAGRLTPAPRRARA